MRAFIITNLFLKSIWDMILQLDLENGTRTLASIDDPIVPASVRDQQPAAFGGSKILWPEEELEQNHAVACRDP